MELPLCADKEPTFRRLLFVLQYQNSLHTFQKFVTLLVFKVQCHNFTLTGVFLKLTTKDRSFPPRLILIRFNTLNRIYGSDRIVERPLSLMFDNRNNAFAIPLKDLLRPLQFYRPHSEVCFHWNPSLSSIPSLILRSSRYV